MEPADGASEAGARAQSQAHGAAGGREWTARDFKETSKCIQVEFYRDNLELAKLFIKHTLKASAFSRLLVSGY